MKQNTVTLRYSPLKTKPVYPTHPTTVECVPATATDATKCSTRWLTIPHPIDPRDRR